MHLNKRGKIIAIILIIILAAAGGYIIEHFEGETFTEEVIIRSESDAYTSEAPSEIDGKININSASAQELELLNGIGPALAQRIIDYREEHGAFKQKEGIMLVPGIGEKMFENIKDAICVE